MLVLDKQIDNNEIVVTLTENVNVTNPSFILVLYSAFSKNEYNIDLGLNISQFPERYDLFAIATSSFELLDTGIYNYKIYEVGDLQKVVEQGYLKIKDIVVNPIIKPVESPNDSGFIVYKEK